MHHTHSISTVRHLRFAALFLCIKYLVVSVAVVLLLGSVMKHDPQWAIAGSCLVVLSPFMLIAQGVAASGAKCPLCWSPVLARKRSMRHRHARTFLGSHRLRVALPILFKNQFRCQYCNESTTLEYPNPRHCIQRKKNFGMISQ